MTVSPEPRLACDHTVGKAPARRPRDMIAREDCAESRVYKQTCSRGPRDRNTPRNCPTASTQGSIAGQA